MKRTIALVALDPAIRSTCASHFAQARDRLVDIVPDADDLMVEPNDTGRCYRLTAAAPEAWRRLSADLARRLETIDVLILTDAPTGIVLRPSPLAPFDWLDVAALRRCHEIGMTLMLALSELLPPVVEPRWISQGMSWTTDIPRRPASTDG